MPNSPTASRTQDLNERQILFCEEYIIDPSSTHSAARKAGYSDTAQGKRLLLDPRVQQYIKERKEEIQIRTGVTPERVLRELARIAYFNITDYLIIDDYGNTVLDLDKLKKSDFAPALAEVSVVTKIGRERVTTTKLKPADKLPALLTLGKHLDMFKQKVEVSGNVGLLQLIENSMTTIEQKPSPQIEYLKPSVQEDYIDAEVTDET